jgi:hypothetical protein
MSVKLWFAIASAILIVAFIIFIQDRDKFSLAWTFFGAVLAGIGLWIMYAKVIKNSNTGGGGMVK